MTESITMTHNNINLHIRNLPCTNNIKQALLQSDTYGSILDNPVPHLGCSDRPGILGAYAWRGWQPRAARERKPGNPGVLCVTMRPATSEPEDWGGGEPVQ